MDETLLETPVAETTPVATTDTTLTETPVQTDLPGTQAAPEPSELEAYLAEQMKEEKPAGGVVDPNAPVVPSTETVVPEAFKEALAVSEYVKSPEQVAQAVRAASEVWDVANGKIPAYQMLEGMRAGNPQGFEKVVGDLIPYIEQLTGQKFGGTGEQTAPDPVAQLRAEIAARDQQQVQERQQQAYTQQVNQVMPVFQKAIAETLGKQFGEGNDEYFIGRIAQLVPEAKMVEALGKGDMKPLEAAMKQVKTEELRRFKTYNDALVKQAREFRKAMPASKGGSQPSATGAPLTATGWTREQSAEFLRTGIAPE